MYIGVYRCILVCIGVYPCAGADPQSLTQRKFESSKCIPDLYRRIVKRMSSGPKERGRLPVDAFAEDAGP